MPFTKVLSNSQRILLRKVPPIKAVGPVAREHTVGVPPRDPQTMAQNITMGVLLSVSMWAIPFWVMYRIPDYQNEDRNVYTGK